MGVAMGSGIQAVWGFDSDASFSADRRHRYMLGRRLTAVEDPQRVAFIMLNPSTADETQNDPTIRRCIGYARRWGFDRLDVVNLFSLRATNPRELLAAGTEASGGANNFDAICTTALAARLVVVAWGGPYQPKALADLIRSCARGIELAARLKSIEFHSLATTKDGHPRHPLYLPADAEPKPWRGYATERRPEP